MEYNPQLDERGKLLIEQSVLAYEHGTVVEVTLQSAEHRINAAQAAEATVLHIYKYLSFY